MTFYEFVLALLDRPAVVAFVGALTLLVTWYARRLEQQVRATRAELGVVRTEVNGRMDALVEAKTEAAEARGVLKGATDVAPEMLEAARLLVQPTPPPRDPSARTRASDRLDPPPPAPRHQDPPSHQP